MLGLIMMSVPLGIAVGLSAVVLVRAAPDGSACDVEEDTSDCAMAWRSGQAIHTSPILRHGARMSRRRINEGC
jgi:hypothetical protein